MPELAAFCQNLERIIKFLDFRLGFLVNVIDEKGSLPIFVHKKIDQKRGYKAPYGIGGVDEAKGEAQRPKRPLFELLVDFGNDFLGGRIR